MCIFSPPRIGSSYNLSVLICNPRMNGRWVGPIRSCIWLNRLGDACLEYCIYNTTYFRCCATLWKLVYCSFHNSTTCSAGCEQSTECHSRPAELNGEGRLKLLIVMGHYGNVSFIIYNTVPLRLISVQLGPSITYVRCRMRLFISECAKEIMSAIGRHVWMQF